MNGKTEVQRETGCGQNLKPHNLTAESRILVTILQIVPSISMADFSRNSLSMCVKGGGVTFRKPPQLEVPNTFLTHKMTVSMQAVQTVSRAAEVLRALRTPPALHLFLP